MDDETSKNDNIILFPRRLRVVPIEAVGDEIAIRPEHVLALIEHDGCLYDLGPLVQQLSPQELREIDAAAPRSGQELWDEVVRRWPALAAEIVAGTWAG